MHAAVLQPYPRIGAPFDVECDVRLRSYSRYQVALSLPSVVGRQGVVETFLPDMSDDEMRALARSAETLRGAVQKYLHKS